MSSKIGRLLLKIYREPRLVVKFVMEVRRSGLKQALSKTKNAVATRMVTAPDGSDFFDYYFASLNQKSSQYREYRKNDEIGGTLKLIAFYLPQFHPFEENDRFWGKGFTEWTNVTKAIAQFYGHYQPKLPGELGFYDLRVKEVQKRQIELAKNYGVFGFCYYYYWFAGKKVMNTPIENLLANEDLDFPFCISWANENWTRRWDGDEVSVLLKQAHTPEDDIEFIREIAKYMRDRRYIRVDGKPVLIVYRPTLFPDIKSTAQRWRRWCLENGVGEILLINTHQAFDSTDPRDIGFDYAIEFAPMSYIQNERLRGAQEVRLFNKNFNGTVFDYESLLECAVNYREPEYIKFRGVTPSWDNEARRPGNGVVFHGSTPQKYRQWLEYILDYTASKREAKEQFVFINAWNEWAEGAMLEPDRKYGYAYLEATYTALKTIESSNRQIVPMAAKRVAVVIHLYYLESWDLFKTLLQKVSFDFDLYITTSYEKFFEVCELTKQDFPEAYVLIYENRGRDILPFLKLYPQLASYEFICKLHSKKSAHLPDGLEWGEYLIRSLLENGLEIIEKFDSDATLGIVSPAGALLCNRDFIATNAAAMRAAQQRLGLGNVFEQQFVAGSMMWMRTKSVCGIERLFDFSEFEIENGQLDGTKAHAVERLICSVALKNGYSVAQIGSGAKKAVLPKEYQMQKS